LIGLMPSYLPSLEERSADHMTAGVRFLAFPFSRRWTSYTHDAVEDEEMRKEEQQAVASSKKWVIWRGDCL
jgi:hypothetical protein